MVSFMHGRIYSIFPYMRYFQQKFLNKWNKKSLWYEKFLVTNFIRKYYGPYRTQFPRSIFHIYFRWFSWENLAITSVRGSRMYHFPIDLELNGRVKLTQLRAPAEPPLSQYYQMRGLILLNYEIYHHGRVSRVADTELKLLIVHLNPTTRFNYWCKMS